MELSAQARARIDTLLAGCEEPREGLLQALEIAQRQRGYIDREIAEVIASRLKLSRADIDDVLSFYPVLHSRPVGRFVIKVCRSLPCALLGSEAVVGYLSAKLGIAPGQTTADGRFTLEGVECLGLCEQAPAMMINDQAFGNLTPQRIGEILSSLEGA